MNVVFAGKYITLMLILPNRALMVNILQSIEQLNDIDGLLSKSWMVDTNWRWPILHMARKSSTFSLVSFSFSNAINWLRNFI